MRLVFALAFLLLLAATPVVAHPESAAPQLNPLVLAAWHEPADVEPGTQWSGFLQLRPGHNVTNATYQVCNVGDGFCFAPLTPAQDVGNDTFRFDTEDYLANGRTVDWKAGWRVGVHWHLDDGSANGSWVPRPPLAVGEHVPLEDLYLTFDIPGEPRGAPGPHVLVLVAVLTLAVLVRRR